MIAIIAGSFAITGALLMLIAGIGAVRMPDLFTRMQATTKASALGAGLLLIATAIHFGDTGVSARALAAIAFIMLTAPVGAHLIGRAAYFLDLPQCKEAVIDELRGQYDVATHELEAPVGAGIDLDPAADPQRRPYQ